MAVTPDDPGDATPAPVSVQRREQMFPILSADDIARVARFGGRRAFQAGERLFATGDRGVGLMVVLSGRVSIVQHDGAGHVSPIVDHGAGSLIGEISSLSGRPALVDADAAEPVEALILKPADLRALIVAEADLGERIMRALILRRTSLIDTAAGGPILIAPGDDPGRIRLAGFLRRNGLPFRSLDPASDDEAADIVAHLHPAATDWPLAILPDGQVLRNPTDTDIARATGMIGTPDCGCVYDVAIVGAGPAGLASAVYAASEGLSVIVLDARGFGGQAGASARIENYFGFPTGITGLALTARGFVQAQKFGAEIAIPAQVKTLECSDADGIHRLHIDDGRIYRSRSVVIASGARYRQPNLDRLAEFEGRGIWYWASPVEAQFCSQQEVILVGGGNSAGQAAVYLAGHAAKVRMMVRGDGLAATMSRYLIDRIAANPRIELMSRTEVVALEGSAVGLERVSWRNRDSGETTEAPIRNLFLFIGADPATEWLGECAVLPDEKGFVATGQNVLTLQTSVPGVFAIGDVRAGSVKRVGGAIGEGATVVAQIHQYLADN
ncbi:FAD-dependent oxidoreductase [Sphingomonas sp. So64.6b]|uniref:FAD-dependent oxidoreductase n=1 Tax=Sphingomonas sp. So64.6b TaxID=2997354 RepID=UPI001602AB38|nr:cyclic nucleotide-binding domain-containing thioredoxin-disulfide reductase [Sphingomonas sp. So64.6b]QNA83616.1 FAD-dependent oxidoreductase [Sphingomonas sp. So64.6b]